MDRCAGVGVGVGAVDQQYNSQGYWRSVVSGSNSPHGRMWHTFTASVDYSLQPSDKAVLVGGIGGNPALSGDDTVRGVGVCPSLHLASGASATAGVSSLRVANMALDTWLWDSATFQWHQLNTTGDPTHGMPPCRFGHVVGYAHPHAPHTPTHTHTRPQKHAPTHTPLHTPPVSGCTCVFLHTERECGVCERCVCPGWLAPQRRATSVHTLRPVEAVARMNLASHCECMAAPV